MHPCFRDVAPNPASPARPTPTEPWAHKNTNTTNQATTPNKTMRKPRATHKNPHAYVCMCYIHLCFRICMHVHMPILQATGQRAARNSIIFCAIRYSDTPRLRTPAGQCQNANVRLPQPDLSLTQLRRPGCRRLQIRARPRKRWHRQPALARTRQPALAMATSR